jgi:5'-nucleotidase
VSALRKANFPVVSANYDVHKTALKSYVHAYRITYRSGIKIRNYGHGVNPESLIFAKNYAGLKYKDPVKTANKIACKLKKLKNCDVVICLSHLGSDSTEITINDFKLARKSKNIDVIIGGHSHTMLENTRTNNADGKPVTIAQMAKSGLYLGRIDLELVKK